MPLLNFSLQGRKSIQALSMTQTLSTHALPLSCIPARLFCKKSIFVSWLWWHIPVTPALKILKHKGSCTVEACLDYMLSEKEKGIWTLGFTTLPRASFFFFNLFFSHILHSDWVLIPPTPSLSIPPLFLFRKGQASYLPEISTKHGITSYNKIRHFPSYQGWIRRKGSQRQEKSQR